MAKAAATTIDPVVDVSPQAPAVPQAAEQIAYMPPTSESTKRGTHTLPSGNKVTNA